MIDIKKKYIYLLGLILVTALVFIFIRWNDYREKALVDVLDADEIEEVLYRKLPLENDVVDFNQTINNQESIQELEDFLSQYKVKKIGRRNFVSKYPDEQFIFQLEYADERISLPSLIERDVVLVEEEQYTVTNGPIDYKWLEDFLEKHK